MYVNLNLYKGLARIRKEYSLDFGKERIND